MSFEKNKNIAYEIPIVKKQNFIVSDSTNISQDLSKSLDEELIGVEEIHY